MTTHQEQTVKKVNKNKPQKEPKQEKPKQEKKPLFEHPSDWKEQIKATFNLQTTIPASQEKFLQENKPDFQGVKTQQ